MVKSSWLQTCRQHHHLGGKAAAGPSVSTVKTRLQQHGGKRIRIGCVGRLLLHCRVRQDGARQRQVVPRWRGSAPPPLPPIVKTAGSVLRGCSNTICLGPMIQTGFVLHPPSTTGSLTQTKNLHLLIKIKQINRKS